MNIKTTLPISEARKIIFDIAEEVQKPNNYYTLTEKGRPKAVIMSAEDFESWAETVEVMREFPKLDRDIAEAKMDIRTGKYKKYQTLDGLKKSWGLIADKSAKKYGVSTVHKAKRSKAARKASGKR